MHLAVWASRKHVAQIFTTNLIRRDVGTIVPFIKAHPELLTSASGRECWSAVELRRSMFRECSKRRFDTFGFKLGRFVESIYYIVYIKWKHVFSTSTHLPNLYFYVHAFVFKDIQFGHKALLLSFFKCNQSIPKVQYAAWIGENCVTRRRRSNWGDLLWSIEF
jgi:hypothetical protein